MNRSTTNSYSLDPQNREVEADLNQLRDEYQQYKEETEEYINELESDNKHKEKEIETLRKKLEINCTKLEENRKEIKQLTIILEREKVHYDKGEKKVEESKSLRAQLILLEQYIETLENQIRHSEFEKEDLKDKFTNLEEVFILQRETASEALSLKEEELERLRQDVLDFKTEIKVLKSQIEGTQKDKDKVAANNLNETPRKEQNAQKSMRANYLMNLFKITSSYKGLDRDYVASPEVTKNGELAKMYRSHSVSKVRTRSRRKTVDCEGVGQEYRMNYVWDSILKNRIVTSELKQEINEMFNKIQSEVKKVLNAKLEIVQMGARLQAEERTNMKLRKKVERLVQELSAEKATNSTLTGEILELRQNVRSFKVNGDSEKNQELFENTDPVTDFASKLLESNRLLQVKIAQREKTIKSYDETLWELEKYNSIKELQELSSNNLSISVSSFSPSDDKNKRVVQTNTEEQNPLVSVSLENLSGLQNKSSIHKTPNAKNHLDRMNTISTSPTIETQFEANDITCSKSNQSLILSPDKKDVGNTFKYLYSKTPLSQLSSHFYLTRNQSTATTDYNEAKIDRKFPVDQVFSSLEDIKKMIDNTVSDQIDSSINKSMLFVVHSGKDSCENGLQEALVEGLVEKFKIISENLNLKDYECKLVVEVESGGAKEQKQFEKDGNISTNTYGFSLQNAEDKQALQEFLKNLRTTEALTVNTPLFETFSKPIKVTVSLQIVYLKSINTDNSEQNTINVEHRVSIRAIVMVVSDVKEINFPKDKVDLKGNAEMHSMKDTKNNLDMNNLEKHIFFINSPDVESYEKTLHFLSTISKIGDLYRDPQVPVLPFSSKYSRKRIIKSLGSGSSNQSFEESTESEGIRNSIKDESSLSPESSKPNPKPSLWAKRHLTKKAAPETQCADKQETKSFNVDDFEETVQLKHIDKTLDQQS